MGRRALSAFPCWRICSACCFQPRTSALFSAPLRSQSTTTTLPRRITIRTITSLSEQKTTPDSEHEHFFRYTSGRWLWDEEQQLRDRYKVFHVAELQSLAAQAVRSDSCVSITKLAEGSYNKVFRLIMNDGKTVLARIPNPNAGPAFYATASEVATMELARDVLQIPVPRVLDWSATSKNAVGSEYIIMEEASGIQLGAIWDQLNPDKKLSIMREIVTIESKMLAVSFSHFGSIYFASDAVESAVPALLTNGASTELKESVYKNFSIGPTVDRSFWKKERSSMQISRGPWRTPQEYALSVGRRELEWIKRFAISKPLSEATLISSAQNSPHAHLQLLERYLQVAPALMDIDPVLARPTLWHGDLHSSNLFVDDGRVTAVIDWQGSWAGPLFLQSQPSPIVDYSGSILLQRPGNFDDLEPEQQAEIKQKIFKSTLYQLYLLETKERNPLLAQAFHLDHGKTRRLPIELAGNTWDDDIVSFREALINVERHWPALGIQGECPYHFTPEEIHDHSVDAEGWNEVQDFFDSIEGLVKRDGWTSPDTFDAAFNFFSELRERGLSHMKGEEKRAFDRQTR
ncbi:kinase-like protein [Aspergillus indologenus CBS 114.80]|uniref:Kinase-like protein n=1 Tax=Aspergillus indologenus CBS 114.80 TaxID=1450541 RepID=A0A2V5J5J6_9EURO|nr:kinase-like protein [Aspergillus indologenus CBS 114.80]